MTANSPFGIIGLIFPLFGVLFIVMGIIQAAYHYKNATGKDRFSIFDITDRSEEGDPADRWIKNDFKSYDTYNGSEQKIHDSKTLSNEINYCPYCGKLLNEEFTFCPKCGKRIK